MKNERFLYVSEASIRAAWTDDPWILPNGMIVTDCDVLLSLCEQGKVYVDGARVVITTPLPVAGVLDSPDPDNVQYHHGKAKEIS